MKSQKANVARQLVARGLLAPEDVEPWCDQYALSSGYYANVYALGDRLIVKLTDDDSDARAAVHVKALQDRGGGCNLVRVYAVFTMHGEYGEYYVIVNERVDELPYDVQLLVYEVSGFDLCRGAFDYGHPRANAIAISRDLRDAGITSYCDWHGRNVMWRHEANGGGRVVLVDFGCSTSPAVEIAA